MSRVSSLISRLSILSKASSCTVQRFTETVDIGGSVTVTWSNHLTNVTCVVQMRGGSESIRYAFENVRRFGTIYVDPGLDITEADRILYNGRTFDIQTIETPDERRTGDRLAFQRIFVEETLGTFADPPVVTNVPVIEESGIGNQIGGNDDVQESDSFTVAAGDVLAVFGWCQTSAGPTLSIVWNTIEVFVPGAPAIEDENIGGYYCWAYFLTIPTATTATIKQTIAEGSIPVNHSRMFWVRISGADPDQRVSASPVVSIVNDQTPTGTITVTEENSLMLGFFRYTETFPPNNYVVNPPETEVLQDNFSVSQGCLVSNTGATIGANTMTVTSVDPLNDHQFCGLSIQPLV